MAEKTPVEIALERIEEAKRTGATLLDLPSLYGNTLPREISQLTNLTSLILKNVSLTSTNTELWQLTNLTSLTINGAYLTTLPPEIAQLTNLISLDVSSGELTTLPPEIGQLTHLTSLKLSSHGLPTLPAEIGQLIQLTSLDLSYNQLVEFPPSIGNLKNLMELMLQNNAIEFLPNEIFLLKNLEKLYLGGNKLKFLPSQIGALTSLKKLSLGTRPDDTFILQPQNNYRRKNNLTELPESIGDLVNLEVLTVDKNDLSLLPKALGNLAKLKELSLDFNPFNYLPSEIGKLRSLHSLDVSFTALEDLPIELLDISENLRALNLQNTQLNIPPEVSIEIDKPQNILSYFFELKKAGKKPLGEIKLIVVGQGSVGKTSLIQRIVKNNFDFSEIKTDGIAIDFWQVKNQLKGGNQDSLIRLNLWDFGGQEIMHATHQFFLTKRSLYLLVLDSRLSQEENRIEYWLKIIQSFGGESPVLIVGNKIDQHPLDIDRRGLQKKYSNIMGVIETSAATGAGIDALKAAITEQVNALPHVRDLLPKTWFAVKTKLEALGHEQNFITHDRYLDLCADDDVTDEINQRTLIAFLHDLGVVLHFQDDARLAALGILNPQWVTNGVYKTLNSHALFQNKGILQRPLLDEILNTPEYPANKRLFIVDMMRKFELCYDIEPDKIFLVPDLLPKDEPNTGNWSDALAFQYHYNVLPSSILTRFIVRMNGFIHNTVWRSGVVLKHGGNTALVKADTEDRKVYIWVSGDEHSRRDFLAKIRGEFDAIHKTIIKIEAREKVPIPGHPEAEPVDYDLLMQMEHNNVDVYHVLAGGKMLVVNVRELLSGVAREADRRRSVMSVNVYVGGDMVTGGIKTGNVGGTGITIGHDSQASVNQETGGAIPNDTAQES